MWILKNLKMAAGVVCITCSFNTLVFAQVSSNQMECFDEKRRIGYTVHFRDNFVTLELKGSAYRLPHVNSYVSHSGVRWSVYKNSEIEVSTTIPYDRYVALYMGTGSVKEIGLPIADAHCK